MEVKLFNTGYYFVFLRLVSFLINVIFFRGVWQSVACKKMILIECNHLREHNA